MVEKEESGDNQFTELVTYLTKNKESRDQALDIIMAFTTTMVNRRCFIDTDIIK